MNEEQAIKNLLTQLLNLRQFKEDSEKIRLSVLPDFLEKLTAIQKKYTELKAKQLTQMELDNQKLNGFIRTIPAQYIAGFKDETQRPALMQYLQQQIDLIQKEFIEWESNLAAKLTTQNNSKKSPIELKDPLKTDIKLSDAIGIFIKHKKLEMLRSKLNVELKTDPQATLQQKHDQYFFIKRDIYTKATAKKEIETFLKTVPATLLSNQQQFKADLLEKINKPVDELQVWEKALTERLLILNNRWSTKLWNYGKASWNFLYRTTIMGLAAELGQWLGNKLAYTEKVNVPQVGKVVGGAVGIYFIYQSGQYNIIRTLSINLGCALLNNQLLSGSMNDKLAKIEGSPIPQLGMSGVFRAANLLVAGGESIFNRDHRYVSYALGGLLGSVGITELAKQFMANVGETVTQERAFALFFLSMLGYDGGRWFSHMSLSIIEKSFLMKQALFVIEEMNKAQNGTLWIAANNANSVWSPSFWSNPHKNTLQLQWASKSFNYHETSCNIFKSGSEIPWFMCEEPQPLAIRPLGMDK